MIGEVYRINPGAFGTKFFVNKNMIEAPQGKRLRVGSPDPELSNFLKRKPSHHGSGTGSVEVARDEERPRELFGVLEKLLLGLPVEGRCSPDRSHGNLALGGFAQMEIDQIDLFASDFKSCDEVESWEVR